LGKNGQKLKPGAATTGSMQKPEQPTNIKKIMMMNDEWWWFMCNIYDDDSIII